MEVTNYDFSDRLFSVFSLDLMMFLVRRGFNVVNARQNYLEQKKIVFRFEKTDELIKAIEEHKKKF